MIFAVALLASRFSEVNPSGGGLYLDLLNIQWWQGILAILVALGLSPAPWLTAMATGRLLFRGDLAERLAERDKHHAALLAAQEARYADLEASNNRNVEAAQQERMRADQATAALEKVAEALEANSHIMSAFRDIATEAAAQ